MYRHVTVDVQYLSVDDEAPETADETFLNGGGLQMFPVKVKVADDTSDKVFQIER